MAQPAAGAGGTLSTPGLAVLLFVGLVSGGCRDRPPAADPPPPSEAGEPAPQAATADPASPAPVVPVLDRCDLGRPAMVWLVPGVPELSGLAVAGDGTILVHDDEVGRVLALDGATGAPIAEHRLEKNPRDDYEGIAALDDGFLLMTSGGHLYSAHRDGGDAMAFERVETGFGQWCELEGLALDVTAGVAYLPCKAARDARRAGGLVLFRWSLDGQEGLPALVVSSRVLSAALGVPILRPTAVARDPATGHLLVLSSQPQVVVELDEGGSIIRWRPLSARYHSQPEAIEVAPIGLLVGDEGPRGGSITIYGCR